MKKEIHPEYQECTITCACGNQVKTRSTRGDYRVEICSQCHPFYTGKQKFVDTAGRVERFRRKYAHLDKQKAEEQAAADEKTQTGEKEAASSS